MCSGLKKKTWRCVVYLLAVLALRCTATAFDASKLNIPKVVDYRSSHLITPVREQGQCGACWAFAPLEVVEALWAFRGRNALKSEAFSVQHLIDCSGISYGCRGGDICDAVDFLQATAYRFIEREAYPLYDATKHATCQKQVKPLANVSVTGYWCENYSGREEDLLKTIAQHGPVVAAVDSTVWRDYLGGIIRFNCDAGEKTHAVVIAGYNLSHTPPFYIVRNSWGGDFGDRGYLYIAVGDNLCGVADRVTRLAID